MTSPCSRSDLRRFAGGGPGELAVVALVLVLVLAADAGAGRLVKKAERVCCPPPAPLAFLGVLADMGGVGDEMGWGG